MSSPRVSVGLPVYNGERYVGQALEALLAQTFDDFEILVSDNASSDATEEICRAFASKDARVSYERLADNIGAAPNFNRVFERARGEYFKWAAHDDLIEPEYLAACLETLDDDPSAVLCHSQSTWIDADGTFVRDDTPDLDDIASDRPSARFRNLILSGHLCIDVFGLIRTDVLARTPRIASYIGSDRALLAELGLIGRFRRVPRPLFRSRDHPGRSIRSLDIRERAGWFDPALAGSIVLPFWRIWNEYRAALARVPLPTAERRACQRALAAWGWRNRRRLWTDGKVATKQVLLRLAPRPRPS